MLAQRALSKVLSRGKKWTHFSASRHLQCFWTSSPTLAETELLNQEEVCSCAPDQVFGPWISIWPGRGSASSGHPGPLHPGLVYKTHSRAIYQELSVPNLYFCPNSTCCTVQKRVSLKETSGPFADLLKNCIVLGKWLFQTFRNYVFLYEEFWWMLASRIFHIYSDI